MRTMFREDLLPQKRMDGQTMKKNGTAIWAIDWDCHQLQSKDSDSDDTEDEESEDEPNDAYKLGDEYTEEVVTEDFTCLLA